MNRKEAEDYVYASYLKAEKLNDYSLPDSMKRDPSLTKCAIEELSTTPCATITGSKGKGSVAHLLSSILEVELSVGMMTSPHVNSFNERFCVNRVPCDDAMLVDTLNEVKELFSEAEEALSSRAYISPIGIQAAAALLLFKRYRTQFNIIECGKGVKYDDVNNIKHRYAVVNSIFLEHTRELGSTVKEIAEDKASIITGEQSCVYVGKQEYDDVVAILKKRANEFGVQLKVYGEHFAARNIKYLSNGMLFDVTIGDQLYKDVRIPLLGEHQARNCALALTVALDILNRPSVTSIKERLANVCIPAGRMQILSRDPLILVDACINRTSCKEVVNVLEKLEVRNVNLIVGIPDDKDYKGVIDVIRDMVDRVILVKSTSMHYIFTNKQLEYLSEVGIDAVQLDYVADALEDFKKCCKPVVILGTTSLITDVSQIMIK